MKLLLATSNPGKLVEVREILAPLGFELLSLEDAAIPPPDETPETTLAELESAEKNQLSHRGRALARLKPLLERLSRDGAL